MIVFIHLLAPALWLVACALIAYLVVHSLLTGPATAGAAIFQIGLTAAAVYCIWNVWREVSDAQRAISAHRQWRPRRKPIHRTHAMSTRYPLSQSDRDSADRVLGALRSVSLLGPDDVDPAALVDRMEQEGFGAPIGAYEVMLMLRAVEEESGQKLSGLAFTHEQVEIEPDDIAKLVSRILAVMEYDVPARDVRVRVPKPAPSGSNGVVMFTCEGREISLPCTFHAKYTPVGLIEGLVRELSPPPGKVMCWESIDSSIVLACLTPTATDKFNAAMGDDPFRFATV